MDNTYNNSDEWWLMNAGSITAQRPNKSSNHYGCDKW
jgi:hypothetical protein